MHVGQMQIQQHQFKRFYFEQSQRLLAVFSHFNVEPLAGEKIAYRHPDGVVVLNDQNGFRHGVLQQAASSW